MTTTSLSMSTLLFHNFQIFTGSLATQPDCIFWSHPQLSMVTGVQYLCHVLFPIPFLLLGMMRLKQTPWTQKMEAALLAVGCLPLDYYM